jgi:cyclomaltodextrinase
MKRQKESCWLLGLTVVISILSGTIFSGTVVFSEDRFPRLILWDVQKKSGQVLPMSDENGDNLYELSVPVLQGSYTYRVMIGADRSQIYGENGEKGGKPMAFELTENRQMTFVFDPATHRMTLQTGETFVPEKKAVLAGNLQKALGNTGGQFGGVWDPASEITRLKSLGNGVFTFTGKLPAGEYEYKIAIDGSWKENYGQGGKQDGPNIPIKIEQEQEVTFYYNDNTHKIADSTWYTLLPDDKLPRIVGDLQTTMGKELWLHDDDFDNLYSLKIAAPKGAYAYRIAFGVVQSPIYGANGTPDGTPIECSIPQDREIIIFFDAKTHQTFCDDGSINEQLLQHDTYSLVYRTPFEAIKTGQEITLRLQARKGDIQKASLMIGKAEFVKRTIRYGTADREYDMTYLETRTLEGSGEVDVWGVTLSLAQPGLYGYKFKVNDLKEYGDDSKAGGIGKAAFRGTEYFPLTVYAADFKTPDWMKKAIVYQIFPDRFFNGKPENDSVKQFARGTEPFVLKPWSDPPSAPNLGNDIDAFWNNDFYGGDLEGIRQKLDYLQSLGVTVLYLNPIFTAGSNHKYDTADYDHIDPAFGTE